MTPRAALAAALACTAAYVAALVWADAHNQVFAQLPRVAAWVPGMAAVSFASYGLRYARWQWLLRRAGHRVPGAAGFAGYLAGFAFTATPGKVGELVRARYFARWGVPAARTLSAFVYERAFDLIAVALLAALAIPSMRLFGIVLGFVAVLIGAVAAVAARPGMLLRLAARLRRAGWRRTARAGRTLARGLAGCRLWLTPRDIAVSFALGLAAWTAIAAAFAWLLQGLGAALPLAAALSTYPTAMLAGAASMLPAGIGTTEATIVALLALHAVPLGTAALAAVGVRFATMWFAVACGFSAMAWLERAGRAGAAVGETR
ncbi:flippase-like domain-containing protein [Acidovorax sp. GBBC 3334]|uniref:lysylphosphatidylglycerol synthase transmembrane domain-containing protein n=1 Tax=Acidovorax sp. GBBC 3334 TaxID=2940496 RepID=UPI00230411F7|nr:lysylphosphatidylglycerol synthase transmembrane domain-containing protein [Acidovorax sp. GBBC 3334]MDA8454913.1 flippase-like domain-containing protein [Acidovorax sp. GBBC 3334]